MGVLDRFEKSVEHVVSAAFAKAFRSEVKPVELASAVRREMDDRAAVVSRGRTVVPNEFVVELSPGDMEQIEQWGADTLAEEIAGAATEHAASQRYSFVGPVEVTFAEDDSLTTGRFKVRSASRRGAVAPATSSVASPRHPIVDIDGQRYLLTGPVTVIGRGSDADIIVDDSGVSRRHLEIRVTPAGVIATDLGSTNGTFVEGHRIDAATLVDGNTITIGRTRIMFWTGADEDDNPDDGR
ncbi:FhaA domain-containing protein [Georgenia sp. AZ-5]|uniref:FhaA domain-containing protein n=1 Tax=Georgenia sp. AZ-5 TaxID=3367526 RepID=UPI003754CC1F